MIYIFSIMVALLAAMSDIKSRIISNKLIIISLVTGSVLRSAVWLRSGDVYDIFDGAAGFMLPYIVLFPIYLLKAIGAGDVKLISVLGLLLGIKTVAVVIFASFVFGGILSVAEIVLFNRSKNYKLPFAVPILIALIYAIIRDYLYEGITCYM